MQELFSKFGLQPFLIRDELHRYTVQVVVHLPKEATITVFSGVGRIEVVGVGRSSVP